MEFLGQVQYRPKSDIYPGMAEMIPVFNPELNHYIYVLADLSEQKIPAVPVDTIQNRLPCDVHSVQRLQLIAVSRLLMHMSLTLDTHRNQKRN